MQETVTGFIVHSYIPYKGRSFYLIGRLENGQTFAVLDREKKPSFFLRQKDLPQLDRLPRPRGMEQQGSTFSTMDREPVVQLFFENEFEMKQFALECAGAGIQTYESDIKKMDKYSIDHRLHSAVTISGGFTKGRLVDRIYRNPGITPASWEKKLRVLSIDIETNPELNSIRAVSLAGSDPWLHERTVTLKTGGPFEKKEQLKEHEKKQKRQELNKVLLLGPAVTEEWIDTFAEEKELLKAFADQVRSYDPDIITGWNVIDFDCKVLFERFKALHIPFNLGRSTETSTFLPAGSQGNNKIIISGRQVVDAMWLVRSSPDHYENYSLNTVARQLLGAAKEVEEKGEDKLDTLERLYREERVKFCSYCLTDSKLVLQILEKTGLLELTLKRSMLTGVTLERAWTSIVPFEHLYTEHLHKRGLVAPDFRRDRQDITGAAGGLILGPEAGIFQNVMIFDFKSLYPSIILTFNIDPASFSFVDEKNGIKGNSSEQYIKAPNGACFSREPGILPTIIEDFFQKREEAKKAGDHIASFVYKILMNSFYGVLGARGCRFASSHLAGAITGFGQKLLAWCEHYLTSGGYTVLYGDTDSLFVTSPLLENSLVSPFAPSDLSSSAASAGKSGKGKGKGKKDESLFDLGSRICGEVNRALEEYIKEEYNLSSRLVLEFEKVYKRLFIPAVRSSVDSKQRGRAKGYAGLIMEQGEKEDRLEIKGMEAVRSDWTELSHEFQRELLTRVFRDEGEKEIKTYIHQVRTTLFKGGFDNLLVYRKMLRNPVSSYTKIKPPQVRAAELAGWKNKRGKIEYIITRSGPQPIQNCTDPPDYFHYLEKQLKPIALSIALAGGFELEDCFDPDEPGTLFDGV